MRNPTKLKINRRGSMLVELSSSLAAASMVMLLGVTLIERSLHWTQTIRQQTDLQRELRILSSTWRDDFSKATKTSFESDTKLILNQPGRQIVFECTENAVERRVESTAPESLVTQPTTLYPLGEGYQAKIEAPYLVVYSSNPAGEQTRIRLRVLGQISDKSYRFLENGP